MRPPARFGRLEIDAGQVLDFAEKPAYEQGWVGAGICVLEPGAFDYLIEAGEGGVQAALALLAQDGQLMAYKHDSFWGSVETLKDRQELEKLWQSGEPPWKTWERKPGNNAHGIQARRARQPQAERNASI